MASEGTRGFVERDDVRQALDELFEECAAKHGDAGDGLPDAAAFLRERGIEPPVDGPIEVQVRVGEDQAPSAVAQPAVRLCGENEEKWAYEKCAIKNGKKVCWWVCV